VTKITSILIKADNMDQVMEYIGKKSLGFVEVTVELDIRQTQPQKKTKEDNSNQISMEEILSDKLLKAVKPVKILDVSGNVMQDIRSKKFRPYIIINKVNYYGGSFDNRLQAEGKLEDMMHNPQRYIHETNERHLSRAANAVKKAEKEAERKKRAYETLTKQFAK